MRGRRESHYIPETDKFPKIKQYDDNIPPEGTFDRKAYDLKNKMNAYVDAKMEEWFVQDSIFRETTVYVIIGAFGLLAFLIVILNFFKSELNVDMTPIKKINKFKPILL